MLHSESELYQIIGELFTARAKIDQLYRNLLSQVDEMSKVISQLRTENEKLRRQHDLSNARNENDLS